MNTQIIIAQTLENMNYNVQQEYSFNEKRFDFAVMKDNELIALINYQGAQHDGRSLKEDIDGIPCLTINHNDVETEDEVKEMVEGFLNEILD
ncbi:MAG: hypothetical protein NC548_34095 [Lachnospiraceae bacterium]|nr:hypothetical protein [Lachnospiraceae bacterium]